MERPPAPFPALRRCKGAVPPPPQQQPPGKRPRPAPTTDLEWKVYDAVKSRADAGMQAADLRRCTGTTLPVATKVLNSLESKGLIKKVADIKKPNRKIYMASDFCPSDEMSGGFWYKNGSLDTVFVAKIRELCLDCLKKNPVATVDVILSHISSEKQLPRKISEEQLLQRLHAMELDREVEKCVSTGVGKFKFIQKGTICYRVVGKGGSVSGFASVPCGVCPVHEECTPDGVISPATCFYFNKWLDF